MDALRDYQVSIVDRILFQNRVGVFADMGLGKSRCVVEALGVLMYPRTLIVAPKLVAESTWPDEFAKWTSGVRLSLIVGDKTKRVKAVNDTDADVFIISRDNLDWLVKTFPKISFDVIVLDESSSFKNFTSKRTRAAKVLCKKAGRVILLTGTPCSNGYQDLFSQIFLLDNGVRLGTSITRFRELYMTGPIINGYKVYNKMRRGSVEIINEKIKDIVFSLKSADYIKLPDRIDSIISLTMNKRDYDEMKRNYLLTKNNKEITASNAAVLVGKLSQLANGFAYDDNKNVIEFSNHKLIRVQEIIDTTAGNILIYAIFKHDIDALIKLGAVKLDSTEKIREWQEGNIRIAVAQPASIGMGTNLQSGGSIVIWYSLPWSLELYQQANKRLHRSGQKNTVSIIHLLTKGTVDEDIYKSLQNKTLTQDTLLNMCKLHIS